jgi:hypothetical protein
MSIDTPTDDARHPNRGSWRRHLRGDAVAAAMAVGRHDELVTTLTRWTTS